jgi:cell division protein FtsN
LGVLGSGLYHSSQAPEVAEQAVEQVNETEKTAENSHKPRFDFYTLLQESEIVIPDESTEKPAPQPVVIPEPDKKPDKPVEEEVVKTEPADSPSTAAKSSEPSKVTAAPAATNKSTAERTVYVLQAGSFKNGADADSVRASLLLLNMQANIETVPAGNNQTWHRVLVGPFNNTKDLSQAKAILTRNGIDSIQLKRRM